jgi:hypothetical protein
MVNGETYGPESITTAIMAPSFSSVYLKELLADIWGVVQVELGHYAALLRYKPAMLFFIGLLSA